MLILNYAHPLTPTMLDDIALQLCVDGTALEERRIAAQIDRSQPIEAEVRRIVDSSGLTPAAWQTTPFVMIPPGLAIAALCLVTELHGRTGYFPSVVSIAPVPNSTPLEFKVHRVLNLQSVREAARVQRLE